MSDVETLRAEYDELKKNLLHHRWLYDYGQPEIEDYEYDQLMLRLKEIEAAHPDWIAPDSPTQIVEVKRADADVEHDAPMLSIDDVFSTADVVKFIDKIKEKFSDAEFLVEEKVDGVSAAMRYLNGRLERAISRGDGKKGNDITANVLSMLDKPILKLDGAPPYIELRGEIFISRKIFDRLNADRIENELEPFANPRNYTAGLMNSKNKSAPRQLSFVVHDMMIPDDYELPFDVATAFYNFLERNGVNVVHHKICRTSEEVLDAIDAIGDTRSTLDHALDGAVVKLNGFAQRSTLGTTAKAPRWSIAYKFPPEIKRTIVREIELNVGRTGRITPVAIFDPITLAGTTVKRATLHNKDYIAKLDIRLGSTIEVFKSGEIIPKVERVVENPEGTSPYKFVEECPSCGSKLDMDDWRCLNPNCPAQLESHIKNFVGKNAMDIEELGENTVRKLIELGLIKNIADIYTLDHETLIKKAGMGPKETENLIKAIKKSKSAPPERLLTGLGIEGVGLIMAQSILEQKKVKQKKSEQKKTIEHISIEKISTASLEELHDWVSSAIKKSAQNLRTVFDELDKGDELDLFALLTKINNVSDKTAKRLLQGFGSIEEFQDASLAELYQWTTFDNNRLQSIQDFLETSNSVESLDDLRLIKGVGKETVERLKKSKVTLDELKDASPDQFAEWVAGSGLKNVRDFFQMLSRIDELDPAEFVFKIKLIDKLKAEKLRDYFGSMDTIRHASLDELQKCLWSPVARNIRVFFDLEENRILIERLKAMGLKVGEQPIIHREGAANNFKQTSVGGGATIVFTGTLSITRARAGALAEAKGFVVKNSITSGTKYLVVGEKSGSKLKKAEALGITILNEEQFYELLKNTPAS